MKLIFRKDENLNISVVQKTAGNEVGFSYVELIKHLIDAKQLKSPKIVGDFSDADKRSIKSMITYINEELAKFNDQTEEM